ncbi:hypothetical protein RJ55_07659 [Drechmeria coniospora]|nr:hypothetical protein RJ55_07659 [Drechmeria coniospora]
MLLGRTWESFIRSQRTHDPLSQLDTWSPAAEPPGTPPPSQSRHGAGIGISGSLVRTEWGHGFGTYRAVGDALTPTFTPTPSLPRHRTEDGLRRVLRCVGPGQEADGRSVRGRGAVAGTRSTHQAHAPTRPRDRGAVTSRLPPPHRPHRTTRSRVGLGRVFVSLRCRSPRSVLAWEARRRQGSSAAGSQMRRSRGRTGDGASMRMRERGDGESKRRGVACWARFLGEMGQPVDDVPHRRRLVADDGRRRFPKGRARRLTAPFLASYRHV